MELFQRLNRFIYLITITTFIVSCGGGEESTGTGQTPRNTKPVITGDPATAVVENNMYSFLPEASDADGDNLSFNISNKPNWADFNTATGQLSGIPDNTNLGMTPNITITVTDGKEESSLPAFGINVMSNTTTGGQFNFMSSSLTIIEGEVVNATITRSNTIGEATVSYGTIGITAINGSDYQGNVYTPITFLDGETTKTVSVPSINDQSPEITETFEIRLTAPSAGYSIVTTAATVAINDNDSANNNLPPTISGTPNSSVGENTDYLFMPIANDADNDPLTFSIINAPAWSTFDTATGTLSGMPNSTQIGTTQGIVISVSDGTTSVSLPQFSITVDLAPGLTGSASLEWSTPLYKENGDLLDDLAGFNVYYGTTAGVYPQKITVNDPTATSVVINNLQVNTTYHFVLTSYNSIGDESKKSNEVLKQITSN